MTSTSSILTGTNATGGVASKPSTNATEAAPLAVQAVARQRPLAAEHVPSAVHSERPEGANIVTSTARVQRDELGIDRRLSGALETTPLAELLAGVSTVCRLSVTPPRHRPNA